MDCKKFFLSILCVGLSFVCFSQNPYIKNEFWNKVHFGGGIGLGFTNGGFNGSISPSAIYQFNEQLAVGTSLNFNYAKFDENKLFAYGGSILLLYNPISFLQLSGEFEQLRINKSFGYNGLDIEQNYWSPALFLGVGYTSQNVTFGIRYDVLYDNSKSIYANAWMPFIRVYF